MQNAALIKENCSEYVDAHTKALDVLRRANGKNHYTEIATILSIHKTTASGLLKKAEKLGLTRKIKTGIYKKITGVLGFAPRKKNPKITMSKTIKDLESKITRVKNRPKIKFPASLVIKPKIITSLDKMVMAYQSLYAVENSLRELIRKALNNRKDWWKTSAPSGVRTAVEKNIKEIPYHAAKREDELEYTHLGQLKEIIINAKNWSAFLPYLKTKDKNDFSATINKAITSRNAIGHCIPLKPKDLKVIDLRLSDILDMMN